MPSRSETGRRKAINRELAAESREKQEAGRAVTPEILVALFEHLDLALADVCDHTLRFTRAFIELRALPAVLVVPWLAEYGGYCDCEVLANLEEAWPDGRAI